MAKAAAIILTGIAIALLVVYGADVAAGVNEMVNLVNKVRAFCHLIIKQEDMD